MRNPLYTFLLLASLCFQSFGADHNEMVRLRELYYGAVSHKADAEEFYRYLEGSPQINANVWKAYQGMSYMIRANYAWNPYNKLSYFTKGKSYLEGAISADPRNVELRFLRFCIQTNAPRFLYYQEKIIEDKAWIVAYYPLIKDEDLKKRIREYMKGSKVCNENEKGIFL